jgi:hypothetical protein
LSEHRIESLILMSRYFYHFSSTPARPNHIIICNSAFCYVLPCRAL